MPMGDTFAGTTFYRHSVAAWSGLGTTAGWGTASSPLTVTGAKSGMFAEAILEDNSDASLHIRATVTSDDTVLVVGSNMREAALTPSATTLRIRVSE